MTQPDWYEIGRRHLWHPYTQMATAPPPIPVVRGEGAYLFAADGRAILDGVCSWWVTLHGHSHPRIADAIARQAATLDHVIFAGCSHEPAARLAAGVADLAPGGLDKVFYSDNGSTAVEVGLKMAFQYWANVGEPSRQSFVAIEGAYHGDTLGTMAVSSTDTFHGLFRPLLFESFHVRNPYLHDQPEGASYESLANREAHVAFNHAISVFDALVVKFPNNSELRKKQALSTNNLAIQHAEQGEVLEAINRFQRALSIQKTLPENAGNLQQLAGIHDNLGQVSITAGRPRESLEHHQRAIAIRGRLLQRNAKHFLAQIELAESHNHLGLILVELKRLGEAEKQYEDAINLLRKLYSDHPTVDRVQDGLADVFNNLGSLYRDVGRSKEAEARLRSAIDIHKHLVGQFPLVVQYRNDLAKHWRNLGKLYEGTARADEATMAYAQANTILADARSMISAAQLDDAMLRHASFGARGKAGHAVRIDGDTLVVGSPGDGTGGAVYVFTRTPSTNERRSSEGWRLQARLVGSDVKRGDKFGIDVAIDGDALLVGAPRGDSKDGAAYMFARSRGNWAEQIKLECPTRGRDRPDRYGRELALQGKLAVVSAFGIGEVYVYEQSGAAWKLNTTLAPPELTELDSFGRDLAVDGNVLAVSAQQVLTRKPGSVYVFRRRDALPSMDAGSTWVQTAKLVPLDGAPGDGFGVRLALAGDTLVAGAPMHDNGTGAAYVFEADNSGASKSRKNSTWRQRAKLIPISAAPKEHFGSNVAIERDTVAVASRRGDRQGLARGSVYMFQRIRETTDSASEDRWIEMAELAPLAGGAKDRFGASIQLTRTLLLIGAPDYDHTSIDSGGVFVYPRSQLQLPKDSIPRRSVGGR